MVVDRVEAEGDDKTAYPAPHHGDGSVFRLIPDRRRCGVGVGGVGIHVFECFSLILRVFCQAIFLTGEKKCC